MRSLGDLPRPALVLEGLGMVLLVLAFLSIDGYLQWPGWLASQQTAVGMVFLGVAMMVPAAAFLVWRGVQGIGPLMRGGPPPEKECHELQDFNDSKNHQDRDPRT